MNPQAYLERIGCARPAKPDLSSLAALVEAHQRTVPFENVDQQLGVEVSNRLDRVFDKIVHRHRGGWCFELNGLFGWLLTELGYDVTMLGGYVRPEKPGPSDISDHMTLMVRLDEPLLVDVGFGAGPGAPLPLRPMTEAHPPYCISIRDVGDGLLRYSESTDDDESIYWFKRDAVGVTHFDTANQNLQTDPDSPFRRTLTAQKRLPGVHIVLRGLAMKTVGRSGVGERLLSTPDELIACLRDDFDLAVPEVRALWPVLKQRHEDLFGSE